MGKPNSEKLNNLLYVLRCLNRKKPSYSSFPELDPKKRLVYTSREAIRALRIGSKTFYVHARKLNLKPHKKKRNRCRWWTYDQLLDVLFSIYNPISIRSRYEEHKRKCGEE